MREPIIRPRGKYYMRPCPRKITPELKRLIYLQLADLANTPQNTEERQFLIERITNASTL